MYAYKVEFIEISYVPKPKGDAWKMTPTPKGLADGLSTANELEALLLEKDKEGFELFSIVPITSNIDGFTALTVTSGLMVTFRKRKTES